MASKKGTRKLVSGETVEFARPKQGRKPSAPELVKVPITIYVLPSTKAAIEQGAKENGMSVSEYGETALVMYDYAIFHCAELVKS